MKLADIAEARAKASKVFNDPTIGVTYSNNEDWDKGLGQGIEVELSKTFTFGVRKNRMQMADSERKLTVGSTVLYYDSLTVRNDGEAVGAAGGMELPQKEFLLLFKLLSYPNKIFTRRQLMDEIWDMDSESDERTVDVHIKRLREKVEGVSEQWELKTVWGVGYKFEVK